MMVDSVRNRKNVLKCGECGSSGAEFVNRVHIKNSGVGLYVCDPCAAAMMQMLVAHVCSVITKGRMETKGCP